MIKEFEKFNYFDKKEKVHYNYIDLSNDLENYLEENIYSKVYRGEKSFGEFKDYRYYVYHIETVNYINEKLSGELISFPGMKITKKQFVSKRAPVWFPKTFKIKLKFANFVEGGMLPYIVLQSEDGKFYVYNVNKRSDLPIFLLKKQKIIINKEDPYGEEDWED